jgi:NAD-dependent deacetylase
MSASAIETAISQVSNARNLVLFTGAGMSADSGMRTFRSGPKKLWGGRRLAQFGTPQGYADNAESAWKWYSARARVARTTTPHAGYAAINTLAARNRRITIITQNVDGLHLRAGNPNVIELHGNLRQVICVECHRVMDWPTRSRAVVPRCECGGILRPNVVLFSEDLPTTQWDAAERAAHAADVFVSIGTSHVVEPANLIPEMARSSGAAIIVVNTRLTDSVEDAVFVRGRAARILPLLVKP